MIPAIASIPTGSIPSSQPATAPGTALSSTSTPAEGSCLRMLTANSATENCRPSVNSSSTTPMVAPVCRNSAAAGTCATPPSPSARPAIRYSGIGDSWIRQASEPSSVNALRTSPSCSSRATETCTAISLGRG